MSIYDSLNPPQREAVFHTEGPLLILAGAGSGKTRVLTHRIAYLIEEKSVSPWNILAITFTNKAAGEMRERVDSLVGEGSEAVWVSTFHSACVRILRRHIENIGYESSFVIYDADDQKSLMREIYKREDIDAEAIKPKKVLSAISDFKNQGITVSEAYDLAGSEDEELIAHLYEEYQLGLHSNNALDFDDLLLLTVKLFEEAPEVLARYQDRFQYIMVDEYQDTNNVQFQFVSMLAMRHHNLCVVGDDDQSIYKFRGANIHNILDFESTYPDARVIRLEQNYRSTKNILKAANGVIVNNAGRKEKTLWTENEEGSLIHFREFDREYDEAEYVIGEISRRHREKEDPYSDFVILYRINAQSRAFEEKLYKADVPYKIVGGINFYSRKEIKDVLCYLRVIANGVDDMAVSRVLNVPARGIGKVTLGRITDYAAEYGLSLFQAMEKVKDIPGISRGKKNVEGFVKLIHDLRAKAGDQSIMQVLELVLEETGYRKELEDEDTDEAKTRLENLQELANKAASFEELSQKGGTPITLDAFLEQIALVSDVDAVEESRDYVTLMTLHSAKGLEFDQVFMVGMEQMVFPTSRALTSEYDDDLEEERRLCYVGITRAKKDLTLTCAKKRFINGEIKENSRSMFIGEIPRDVVETGNQWGVFSNQAVEAMRSRNQTPLSFVTAPAPKPVKPSFSSLKKGAPSAKEDGINYLVGDTVRHIKYGIGVVKNIRDAGRDYEVLVDFERYGEKKMLAGFAKLEKV